MTKYLQIKQLPLPTLASEKKTTLWVRIPDIQKRVYLTLLIQHLQTDKKRSEKTKVFPPEIRPSIIDETTKLKDNF